jgi:hypothetical protein
MTEQEKTLLAPCVSGNKTAWHHFVQQYSSLVYHTIRKTLASYDTDPHLMSGFTGTSRRKLKSSR